MSDFSSEDDRLRVVAREKIQQEKLPRTKATRIFGGRGAGQRCELCERLVLQSEAEMELEFENGRIVRFHLHCQTLWDVARQASQSNASRWISIDEQLPPLHTVVEARLRLGESRSVILNVLRICDGHTGPVIWLNATTNGQLPAHWSPLEWRDPMAPAAVIDAAHR